MFYKFEFRPYCRKFVSPLNTSHGVWENRHGVILRLVDEAGKVGWGEIAPISWFGSETMEEAVSFCRKLPEEINDKTIFSIPDELPACQFGFESAVGILRKNLSGNSSARERETFKPPSDFDNGDFDISSRNFTSSSLLPAGKAALHQWRNLWEYSSHTFKWKIGVYPVEEEVFILDLLAGELPAFTKLRLDANGGLSYGEAEVWMQKCDIINENDDIDLEIEFIEQPLWVNQFSEMLELSRSYTTKIALDESVATLKQLQKCYEKGWREIFVIKAGIAGSPSRLREFCLNREIDTVFSSVFETSIGREAALSLAAELSHRKRAVGFGVNHYFAEDEEICLDNLWKKTSDIL
ncbi:MAG: o-succinylbenzoate synthase [Rivularia sp. ALOHA_DT_140]|nr:o-succinylbenzoate synthase [Rivularia sp. ALOHA_DT_140]